MGTWGIGITQDDEVADVIDMFETHLKNGASVPEASARVAAEFHPDDPDAASLQRFGLAYAQWKYGALDPVLLAAVRSDIQNDVGLDRWREGAASDLNRRKAVLRRFLEQLESPNPRPKRFPRLVVRAPKYRPGDCLAVKLSNGQFGAALVLAADQTNPEYGRNLIASLEYMSTTPPGLHVFQKRDWLRLTHHNWRGQLDLAWYPPGRYRSEAPRFQVVGSILITSADPKDSNRYSGWLNLGNQVVLEMQWRNAT